MLCVIFLSAACAFFHKIQHLVDSVGSLREWRNFTFQQPLILRQSRNLTVVVLRFLLLQDKLF